MDLYIQIGVLFAFLTAFALFTYYYSSSIETIRADISDSSEEFAKTVDAEKDKDVIDLKNNPSVDGVRASEIIKDSIDKGLAVFLQTERQQGFIVNYGYQLRHKEYAKIRPVTTGYFDNTGTDFEKHYVVPTNLVFGPGGVESNTFTALKYNHGSLTNNLDNIVEPSDKTVKPHGNDNRVYGVPKINLYYPTISYNASIKSAETFKASGYLFTSQELKLNAETNSNFAFLDSPTSPYYLNKASSFYASLIVDENYNIIGVYLEEHSVLMDFAILGQAMLSAGVIDSLY